MEINHKLNIAGDILGTKVIYCSDDFFAPASRMLQDSPAVFIEGKYDDNGKWMDGWESRRRRDAGNDFCILKLGHKSKIFDFDIDTSHFTGNYAPAVEVLAFASDSADSEITAQINSGKLTGTKILSLKELNGDSHNQFASESNAEVTHLKISIFPDGGIARFRVFGEIVFDNQLLQQTDINVLSLNHGAKALFANDEHFGKLQNILQDTTPQCMADGWETRRRREPGNDWGVISLARPAIIKKIIVDTSYFKGNFPHRFSINAANLTIPPSKASISQSLFWQELIAKNELAMNQQFEFVADHILISEPINIVRLNIFPDGGIARLKLIGQFV